MSEPAASRTAARLGLLAAPLLLAYTLIVPAPQGMSQQAWATVGMTALMAIWWATEAVPLAATSLLPVLLVPALGIGTAEQAAAPYANPTVFLFLGGFLLGLAVERWNLHRRIALLILLALGAQPRRQLGGFMLTTAFVSMWVSNTATTIMMLPIGLSVIARLPQDEEGRRYATALLLGISFSASIGGMATLVGTPPNAFLAGYVRDSYGIRVGFAQWMALALPVAVCMLLFTWWWLGRRGFGVAMTDTRAALRTELAALGSMSWPERTVGVLFALAALSWILQPWLAGPLPWLTDTAIAVIVGLSVLLLPANWKRGETLLPWERAQAGVPWGVLLLFGGGLSLAAAISRSGLAQWMTQAVAGLGPMPAAAVLLLLVAAVVALSEVASNTATAAAVLPLVGALAIAGDLSPLVYAVPATLAASCGFMLPVATPPNTIVYGTGRVPIATMLRAGFALDLMGIALIVLACLLLVEPLWLR